MRDFIIKNKIEHVYDAHDEMRKRIKKQFEQNYDILMKPEIHEADCLVLDCPTGCFKRVPDKVVSEPYEVGMQAPFEIAGDETAPEKPKKPTLKPEQLKHLAEMQRQNKPIYQIEQKRREFEREIID